MFGFQDLILKFGFQDLGFRIYFVKFGVGGVSVRILTFGGIVPAVCLCDWSYWVVSDIQIPDFLQIVFEMGLGFGIWDLAARCLAVGEYAPVVPLHRRYHDVREHCAPYDVSVKGVYAHLIQIDF